jgi:hypothetical protein
MQLQQITHHTLPSLRAIQTHRHPERSRTYLSNASILETSCSASTIGQSDDDSIGPKHAAVIRLCISALVNKLAAP